MEFTGYFHIPVTDGAFGVYMGGGVGVYFGERRYALAGCTGRIDRRGRRGSVSMSSAGCSYRFTEGFMLSVELKFRDAQFEATNAFAVPSVRYGDITGHPPGEAI